MQLMIHEKATVEICEADRLAERFIIRAQTIFYIRLALISLSLCVFCVPVLQRQVLGEYSLATVFITIIVALGIFSARLWSAHKIWGRWANFATLIIDLIWIVYLIAKTGAIMSPIMAIMPIYAMMFALLFNNPLTILPPLIVLPIITGIDVYLANHSYLIAHFLVVLFYGLLNGICVYITSYSFAVEEAQSRKIFLLQQKLRHFAVAEQRAQIAREIHDGLGANVSSLGIQCEYLLTLPQVDEQLRDEIIELKKSAEDSMSELRQAVSVMRDEFDLLQQLHNYCQNFKARHHTPVEITVDGPPFSLSTEHTLMIFRIIQEALTNCAKHAQAKKIAVNITNTEQHLQISVEDNGIGFDQSNKPINHYGLINLHERSAKMGAQLTIQSAPGKGTKVQILLLVSPQPTH